MVARDSTRTPEGTTNVVRLLGRVASGGTRWLRIGLGALPNGTTGWVPRADVGSYQRTTTRLVRNADILRVARVLAPGDLVVIR